MYKRYVYSIALLTAVVLLSAGLKASDIYCPNSVEDPIIQKALPGLLAEVTKKSWDPKTIYDVGNKRYVVDLISKDAETELSKKMIKEFMASNIKLTSSKTGNLSKMKGLDEEANGTKDGYDDQYTECQYETIGVCK